MIAPKGGQLHKPWHLGVGDLHDGIGIGGAVGSLLLLFPQAHHLVDTSVEDEGVDVIFHDDHRLQVGEHLLIEVLLHERPMKGLHLVGLVEDDAIAAQLREDHLVEDGVILLFMSCHLTVDLDDGLQRLFHRLIALDALQQGAMITRHTDLVELFQVGGVDREELDPLIDGQPLIFRLQEHPVIEREPADIAFEIGVTVIIH